MSKDKFDNEEQKAKSIVAFEKKKSIIRIDNKADDKSYIQRTTGK